MLRTTVILLALAASTFVRADEPRRIGPAGGSEWPEAVVAPADRPLVHTAQIQPLDGAGGVVGRSAAEQAGAVLDRLAEALRLGGSELGALVKLNVYAADHASLAALRGATVARLGARPKPAISAVITRLPHPSARVALDAVALGSPGAVAGETPKLGPVVGRLAPLGASVAPLPAGRRIYISGQADPAPTLAEATRKTLEGLDQTLTFLGLDRRRVVSAKAFLTPMSAVDEAARELRAFFGEGTTPPLVFVEWRTNPPIEIELVVAGGPAAGGEPVEFLAPPALKPSPVFSRIARVNRGDLVYLSDLAGPAGATAEAQVDAIFGALRDLVGRAGGDLRNLAKATYYVADDDAGRALNELRPRYYDPARPPAASKATVAAVGAEGRTVTVDMIAVTPPR